MIAQKGVCKICSNPVAASVCMDCYFKQFGYWLRDLKIGNKNQVNIIVAINENLFHKFQCSEFADEKIGFSEDSVFTILLGIIIFALVIIFLFKQKINFKTKNKNIWLFN